MLQKTASEAGEFLFHSSYRWLGLTYLTCQHQVLSVVHSPGVSQGSVKVDWLSGSRLSIQEKLLTILPHYHPIPSLDACAFFQGKGFSCQQAQLAAGEKPPLCSAGSKLAGDHSLHGAKVSVQRGWDCAPWEAGVGENSKGSLLLHSLIIKSGRSWWNSLWCFLFLIREDDDGGSSEAFLPKRPICSLHDSGQTMRDQSFVQLWGLTSVALHRDQIPWHIAMAASPINLICCEYALDFTKIPRITVWFHNLIHETVIPSSQYTECFFFFKKSISPEQWFWQ